MIERVSHKQETALAVFGRQHPRLQGGQVRIVELIHIVLTIVERRPAAHARLIQTIAQLSFVRIVRVIGLHKMRGAIDERWPRLCQHLQKLRVGF